MRLHSLRFNNLLKTFAIIFAIVAGVSTTLAQTSSPANGNTRQRSSRKINVQKPDLEAIKKATSDPNSKFYFPTLMEKYNLNDTVMTNDEYRHLYLGYMFQEDYDPYRTSPYSEVTEPLRAKATHTKEEIDTIRKYAGLALLDNPFDLRQMSFLIHVLKEAKKPMSATIWEYRLEHLLGAIKSTGSGENTDNAWYVIYPVHEYDMVRLLGYEAVDADFIEPGYDYLTVRPASDVKTSSRGKKAEGFYFNVQIPQSQYEMKHPELWMEETEEVEIIDDDYEEDDDIDVITVTEDDDYDYDNAVAE